MFLPHVAGIESLRVKVLKKSNFTSILVLSVVKLLFPPHLKIEMHQPCTFFYFLFLTSLLLDPHVGDFLKMRRRFLLLTVQQAAAS